MLKLSRMLPRGSQRGVGLVELMVGITVGLIVTAGAAIVATRQINEHRRLMLEVQMQQDLRIAADLLQQDMRRAGYRGLPANGVWEPERNAGATPAKEAASSPYASLSNTADTLLYQYAKQIPVDPNNPGGAKTLNTTNVVASNEQFGVQWNKTDGTLELKLGLRSNGSANWQPITDPNVITIENFAVSIVTQQISLADLCDPACVSAGNCPTQAIRNVTFTIRATAKSDPSVARTLTVNEKIRADDVSGACPA